MSTIDIDPDTPVMVMVLADRLYIHRRGQGPYSQCGQVELWMFIGLWRDIETTRRIRICTRCGWV